MKWMPSFRLILSTNIVAACADILAGFSVASYISKAVADYIATHDVWLTIHPIEYSALPWFLLFSVGLYGRKIILQDVWGEIKQLQRSVPNRFVFVQGVGVLFIGFVTVFQVPGISFLIAGSLVILKILYDNSKNTVWKPVYWGFCKGGNLLLGISAIPELPLGFWPLSFLPIAYIASITIISRKDVHEANKSGLYGSLLLYILVIAAFFGLSYIKTTSYWQSLAVVLFFAILTFPFLLHSINGCPPRNIDRVMKECLIPLIAMDATLTAIFAGWLYGLLVVALLPISRFLGRRFAVT